VTNPVSLPFTYFNFSLSLSLSFSIYIYIHIYLYSPMYSLLDPLNVCLGLLLSPLPFKQWWLSCMYFDWFPHSKIQENIEIINLNLNSPKIVKEHLIHSYYIWYTFVFIIYVTAASKLNIGAMHKWWQNATNLHILSTLLCQIWSLSCLVIFP
jgi:hypothetical protein